MLLIIWLISLFASKLSFMVAVAAAAKLFPSQQLELRCLVLQGDLKGAEVVLKRGEAAVKPESKS